MAVLSPGANVRLLGSVIECAAGALPDKSHANAVEAPGGFRVWDAQIRLFPQFLRQVSFETSSVNS